MLIPRLRYAFFILSSLSFVAEFFLTDSDQSARLGKALSFDLQPSQGRSADFFPTGRSMTWGRPPWTKTPRRVAAKLAALGLESASTTGRMTTRRKSSHAASRRPTMARVPPPRRLLGAARRSVGLVRQSAEEAQGRGGGDQAG